MHLFFEANIILIKINSDIKHNAILELFSEEMIKYKSTNINPIMPNFDLRFLEIFFIKAPPLKFKCNNLY